MRSSVDNARITVGFCCITDQCARHRLEARDHLAIYLPGLFQHGGIDGVDANAMGQFIGSPFDVDLKTPR
ncbi:hypothetical protein AOG28_06890 [Cobetia sp. UCD-24C]|nr:hypothetical protein AOG28_06890 [Cobetia sp. UCD-24C]